MTENVKNEKVLQVNYNYDGYDVKYDGKTFKKEQLPKLLEQVAKIKPNTNVHIVGKDMYSENIPYEHGDVIPTTPEAAQALQKELLSGKFSIITEQDARIRFAGATVPHNVQILNKSTVDLDKNATVNDSTFAKESHIDLTGESNISKSTFWNAYTNNKHGSNNVDINYSHVFNSVLGDRVAATMADLNGDYLQNTTVKHGIIKSKNSLFKDEPDIRSDINLTPYISYKTEPFDPRVTLNELNLLSNSQFYNTKLVSKAPITALHAEVFNTTMLSKQNPITIDHSKIEHSYLVNAEKDKSSIDFKQADIHNLIAIKSVTIDNSVLSSPENQPMICNQPMMVKDSQMNFKQAALLTTKKNLYVVNQQNIRDQYARKPIFSSDSPNYEAFRDLTQFNEAKSYNGVISKSDRYFIRQKDYDDFDKIATNSDRIDKMVASESMAHDKALKKAMSGRSYGPEL